VEGAGATVFSTQVKPRPTVDQPADPAAQQQPGEAADRQIDMEIVFDARIVDLQKILFTIETGAPFIFVDEMQMQPAKAAQPGEAADPDPLLHVVLTMHGFWRS
jgi:Type II secretion system (T2SS), protein M subtype b